MKSIQALAGWASRFFVILATFCAMLPIAQRAQAELMLTVVHSPDQRVAEGQSSKVTLDIFNASETENAFIVVPVAATCELAVGSPDLTDFIICNPLQYNTSGTLGTLTFTDPDLGTRVGINLSIFSRGKNHLVVTLPFDTPTADTGEPIDFGINLITFKFVGADGLAEFTHFEGTFLESRARVDVFDVPEPVSLELAIVGIFLIVGTRMRPVRKSAVGLVTGCTPGFLNSASAAGPSRGSARHA